jgi:SpoVK/Ycf46/Vps4 family AAA+-type ATPase
MSKLKAKVSKEMIRFSELDSEGDRFYYKEDKSMVIGIQTSYGKSSDLRSITFTYLMTDENVNIIHEIIEKFSPEETINDRITFSTIGTRNGQYVINQLTVKHIDVNEIHYNYEINFENLSKIIESDKNGIIIFSGIPGSGKTSLIKYLSGKSEKTFCIIPSNLVDALSMPDFGNFIVSNFQNSVLIIEDCETVIASRESQHNQMISTLLNFGDGIVGDALNLKIILTYNTTKTIDKALLRKGRTLFMHKFDKISTENANEISKQIGSDIVYQEPAVLCDIFNTEDNGDLGVVKSKVGIY